MSVDADSMIEILTTRAHAAEAEAQMMEPVDGRVACRLRVEADIWRRAAILVKRERDRVSRARRKLDRMWTVAIEQALESPEPAPVKVAQKKGR
jgi:hypothetical protein